MAQFHESIRNALSEFDKFLEALKSEKLSKKLLSNKDKLIELLKKLRDDYPALAPTPTNDIEGSDGSAGRVSNLSVGAADEDDYAYTETSDVPEVAVKDLTNAVKMGYLEKKRKKATLLQSAYQKRFCVIHNKTFYYYEKSKDVKQSGAFFLEGYEFREAPQHVKEAAKKELSFEMVAPGKRSYQFLAESKEEFQSWRVIIESGGEPTGSSDIPIEGEFDDTYEYFSEASNYYNQQYDDASAAIPGTENYECLDDGSKGMYDDARTPQLPSMPPPAIPKQPIPKISTVSKQAVSQTKTPAKPQEQPRLPIRIIVNPDEDFENMYYGKWPNKADSEAELSFKVADIIHIISREYDKQGWWIGRMKDTSDYGLVPKQMLSPAYRAM
ncbi:src kinase-associated phosphoprotein 2-A-like isoform X5 [Haliotis rufescens]|uniref:src kinase-associated phosphoprotein 2-A-like isoform X5 n=1 Tax=Haliotis rufescens TaxID=6454 RepID=UPI001EAFEBE9|nr:src kinase-associated phosphoprotein 2-A-like isoform X5 [Haliotis rufescens]